MGLSRDRSWYAARVVECIALLFMLCAGVCMLSACGGSPSLSQGVHASRVALGAAGSAADTSIRAFVRLAAERHQQCDGRPEYERCMGPLLISPEQLQAAQRWEAAYDDAAESLAELERVTRDLEAWLAGVQTALQEHGGLP